MIRIDGRNPDQLRPVKIIPGIMRNAEGSVHITMGGTELICTATVDSKVAPHLKDIGGGWITAEYAMLPRSSAQRVTRDGMAGKVSGRSQEIQRLIGRSLRAVVDLKRLGDRTIILDCDVIQADGGTRTAAITGSFIALVQSLIQLKKDGKIPEIPIYDFLAAVSVGIVEGVPVLDLCYLEDSQAEVDMNVVLTGKGNFVEVQGTAEHATFSKGQMDDLLNLAKKGIGELIQIQKNLLEIEKFDFGSK